MRFPLTIERDTDDSYIVSDEHSLCHGHGATKEAALTDYHQALREYQELLSAHTDAPIVALYERLFVDPCGGPTEGEMNLLTVTPYESTEHRRALIVIARGCTRTVFLIGRWAIKIPTFYSQDSFLRGLLANIQERAVSRYGINQDLLCPVLFALPFGLLIVMPRCEPLRGDLPEHEARRFFYEAPQQTGYSIPVEDKPSSFGYLEGRLVAVDYGS